MARDKICTPFLALASPENRFTVSTIEDMKGRKYLKIGDVVELNGYYTAGDGAGHQRKIEATDDGSGVQLANGLWANIVHNGEVNVSWFGAKEDYSIDQSSILEKSVEYCGERFIPLVLDKNIAIYKDVIIRHNNFTLRGVKSDSEIQLNNASLVLEKANTYLYNVTLDSFILRGTGIKNKPAIKTSNISECNFLRLFSINNDIFYQILNEFSICKVIQNKGNTNGSIFKVEDSAVVANLLSTGCNFCISGAIFNFTTGAGGTGIVFKDNWIESYINLIKSQSNSLGDFVINDNYLLRNELEGLLIQNEYVIDYADMEYLHFEGNLVYETTTYEKNFIKRNSDSNNSYSVIEILELNKIYTRYVFVENLSAKTQTRVVFSSRYPFSTNELALGFVNCLYKYKPKTGGSESIELLKWDILGSSKLYLDENSILKLDDVPVKDVEIVNESSSQIQSLTNGRILYSWADDAVQIYVNGWKKLAFQTSVYQSLDTPYMTTKMQSEGVYEDFVSYMDLKLEYDNQQRELETQRQQAFAESGMENYEEWLATQPMMLPVENEPQPSEALLKFKEKYLG